VRSGQGYTEVVEGEVAGNTPFTRATGCGVGNWSGFGWEGVVLDWVWLSGLLDSRCAVRHILIILSPAVSPLLMRFPVSYVSRAVLLILFRARFLCLDSHYVGFPRVFEHSHLLTLVLYLL